MSRRWLLDKNVYEVIIIVWLIRVRLPPEAPYYLAEGGAPYYLAEDGVVGRVTTWVAFAERFGSREEAHNRIISIALEGQLKSELMKPEKRNSDKR